MSRPTKVVILCEDQQQACFARRFLKNRGYTARDLRVENCPPGKGSAEQWVRSRFPVELKAYRDNRSRLRIALIAVIDADTEEVPYRVRGLDSECDAHEVGRRQADEAVLLVVPKRSIETWLAYLRGQTVDEMTQYARYSNPRDCQADVDKLDAMCRRGALEPVPPPSLERCCDDFRRFLPLLE
jgi:hypothetical protein